MNEASSMIMTESEPRVIYRWIKLEKITYIMVNNLGYDTHM